MPLILLCLLGLVAGGLVAGCDKKVVRSVDVPMEDAFVEEALTEDVLANGGLVCSGSLHLPTGADMLAEELQVISFFGAAKPNAAGAFTISMADSKSPQFVFATGPATDNSLLLGYVNPLQSEHVNLSCESTAVGLAFLSPLMIGTTAEQRSEFINEIKVHPNFPLLVEAVEAAFQADPQNMLDGTVHPELYQQAAEISVDVWQQMTAAGKLLAPEAAQQNVCNENKQANVWLWDKKVDSDIVFCNPKTVYYVSSLSNSNEDFSELIHIRPKRGAFTPGFSLNWGTDPEPTNYPLSKYDVFEYYITKGYDYRSLPDLGAMFDWNTAYGRATQLNIAQFFIHIIDIFAGIVLQIPDQVLDIASPEITDPLPTAISEGKKRDTSWFDVAIGVASIATVTVSKVVPWLIKNVSSDLLPKEPVKFVKEYANVFKSASLAIKGYKFANRMVPFLVDLPSAESGISGRFRHESGVFAPLFEYPAGVETATFSLPGSAEMEFVWIEPGTFWMGSPEREEGRQSDEGLRRVTITKGFWLGMYEVTARQWEAVMRGTGRDTPWLPSAGKSNIQSGLSYPATHISWEDTQAFIDALNQESSEWKYRLPTEAEWEYACRAEGLNRWSFGGDSNQLGDYAWYQANSSRAHARDPSFHAHAVGTRRANRWGLFDMHGNVWEWVQDWYGLYDNSDISDPKGPDEGDRRVIRGGSFESEAEDTRAATRDKTFPDYTHPDIGFRLVRIEEPEPPWIEETFPLSGGAEMKMVRVEPGGFEMGSNTGPFPNQGPAHDVEITKGFWLGMHEVTQGQWEAVMGTTPWEGQENVPATSHALYPATYKSWEDVQEFVDKLNEEAGGRWYRLPTEAEWEYACRAGSTTQWSSGGEDDALEMIQHYMWFSDLDYAQVVGLKRPNAWGLRDMHGNVAEWVQDWYDSDYYNFSPLEDPQGPSWPPLDSDRRRVARGGAFTPSIIATYSASRRAYPPTHRDAYTGVRLVKLDVPEELEEPEELPTWTFELRGGAEMGMMWIEPGEIEMGLYGRVEISEGFWLGTHEVTQGQWEAVMGGTPWATPWSGESSVQEHPSHPAVYISWEDVQEFIARLNEAEGAQWYRLPSEAEWEYACRAGTQTYWSFGDDESHLEYFAWYGSNANGVNEVGLKRPNAWGLRDMHGNVAEWVQDWHGSSYYQEPLRLARGGAFNNDYTRLISSDRSENHLPDTRDVHIGFRLVRDETPQEPTTRTVSLPEGPSMEMVWIEPGVFQMGSPESERGQSIERPEHQVEISKGFWLGKYEVTQEQWEVVMETTPWSGVISSNPSYPAVKISWEEVQAFIDTLNVRAGERRYRLPSEAEWEYACRAGLPTRWSFGNDERRLEYYAWYRENATSVKAVGQTRANAWGLYDMHGNVWEWVQDGCCRTYDISLQVDPLGPDTDTGAGRIARGGGYANSAGRLRSAHRSSFPHDTGEVSRGFRLLMVEEPEEAPPASSELQTPEEARSTLDEQGIDFTRYAFLDYSEAGDVSVVRLFIAAGMDINAQSDDGRTRGRTALVFAAREGHVEVVRLLLEHGADINAQSDGVGTALGIAAREGHVDVARLLLEYGADINVQGNNGDTALMRAAEVGHVEVVRLLLEHGADINARDNGGRTALLYATWALGGGRVEVVRLLLEHGADINAQGNNGWTALLLAAQEGHADVARLLLEHGAAINAQNNDGDTALMRAAWRGEVEVVRLVRLLLEHGADINAQNDDGWTALMFAAWGGHVDVVRLLLERGADTNAQNNDGDTALSLAKQRGHQEVIDLLEAAGATE